MSEPEESLHEQPELQHYIAYMCSRCQAQFVGRGSTDARYCYHCGALLKAEDALTQAGSPGRNKRVLVVDDSQVLRSAFAKMIHSLGHEVLEAANGQEAMILAKSEDLDLIITDLNMPRMSGLELIEHLRHDDALKEIPVIILTSESGASTIAAGLGHRVLDYIVKDIGRIKEIRERLKKYL